MIGGTVERYERWNGGIAVFAEMRACVVLAYVLAGNAATTILIKLPQRNLHVPLH